jgi:hypothetical protein
MRIVLVNPPNAGILKAVGVHFQPLGLLSLVAYLEREGYHPEMKDRVLSRPWTFLDAQHMVFKHDHISFIRIQWLLLKANLLSYTRSRKGRSDVLHLIKRRKLGGGTVLRFIKDYFIG